MAKVKIDHLIELNRTRYDKPKEDLPLILDKFAKAMGVTLDVDTDTGTLLMDGKPDQVYLATMIEKAAPHQLWSNRSTSIVLFAKPMTSDQIQPIWRSRTYQPRKLVSKSTIDGLSNKMLLLSWYAKGKAVDPAEPGVEVQTVSIVPLADNERDAVARRLRRKYRVKSRFNNRFVVLNTCDTATHFPSIAFCDRYYGSHISDIMPVEDVYSEVDMCIEDTMTLFDRQNVDKVFKMVTSQRGSNGRVREVVQYCMEPVLCSAMPSSYSDRYSWLVFKYLKQSKCDDEKLFDQIRKYRSFIQDSFGLHGMLYPRETTMSWLHLDI